MKNGALNLFLCSAGCLALWLVPLHVHSKSSGFTYFANGAKVSSLWLDPTNGKILIHDRGYPARFVSDQNFFVVESEILDLAIPKKINAEQWMYAGKLYKHLGKSKLKWMGKWFDVYRITVNVVDAEIIAIYNVRFGVLGFEFVDGSIIKKTLLRGHCGYAALGC